MYHHLLEIIRETISPEIFSRTAREINRHERRFSYKGFHESAAYCASQLKKYGASQVRTIPLPSDGKTTYLDEVMPRAWDIKDASLEIVKPLDAPLRMLAKHREEPHCIANRSAPTPPAGIEAGVVLEEDMRKGADIKGKIVFISYAHPQEIKGRVVKEGGLGIISDYSPRRLDMPDSTFWVNGWSEGPGWYHTKEEKSIFCFSITPRKGEMLRKLLRKEREIIVRAKVDSRIYDGSIDTITGIIPGQRKEEILLLAHLYEPQASDDATGGAAVIEICRTLNSLISKGILKPPRLTIRFLLSMELYGVSAYLADKRRREKIIAAINLDSFTLNHRETESPLTLRINPPSRPFFGDILAKSMAEYYLTKEDPSYPWGIARCTFSDDTFISDTSIGIPLNWFHQKERKYWHSSANTFEKVDWLASTRIMTMVTGYLYFLAAAGRKETSWLIGEVAREGKRIIIKEAQILTDRLIDKKEKPAFPRIENEVRQRLEFISTWQKERLLSLSSLGYKSSKITKAMKDAGKDLEQTAKEETSKTLHLLAKTLSLSAQKGKGLFLTPLETMARDMVITRKTIGFPHCLAKVPFEKRIKRPWGAGEVLSWMDGKRDLLKILRLVEQDIERRLTEDEISGLIAYFSLLEKYSYLDIKHTRRKKH